MAKREIDFTKKLVSTRTHPKAKSTPITFTTAVTSWDHKPLPADQKWHLIQYGKLMKIVNQFGEEREGKKLVPIVTNPVEAKGAVKDAPALATAGFDFEKAFDKLTRENREIKKILANIQGQLGQEQHVSNQHDSSQGLPYAVGSDPATGVPAAETAPQPEMAHN